MYIYIYINIFVHTNTSPNTRTHCMNVHQRSFLPGKLGGNEMRKVGAFAIDYPAAQTLYTLQ